MSDKETNETEGREQDRTPCPDRFLYSHMIGGTLNRVYIGVIDEPGPGGACHDYSVGLCARDTPSGSALGGTEVARIKFQKGPIAEAGLNGLTMESLLAIVIDRLQGFQSSEYSCRENALALARTQEAMHWLHDRTMKRMQRGVEGTNQK